MICAVVHIRYQDFSKEYLDKLRIECQSVGVHNLFIIDETGFNMTRGYHVPEGITIRIFDSIEEIEQEFEDFDKVYIEKIDGKKSSVSLSNFTHPDDNVLYIVGANSHGLVYKEGKNAHWVHLEMKGDNGVFYAETALIITLYDRLVNLK